MQEVDLGSDARKEEVRGSGWVEKDREEGKATINVYHGGMVAAAGTGLDGVQTVPLENGGEGKCAKPYPLPPVSIRGRFLWGINPLSFSGVLAFGVG